MFFHNTQLFNSLTPSTGILDSDNECIMRSAALHEVSALIRSLWRARGKLHQQSSRNQCCTLASVMTRKETVKSWRVAKRTCIRGRECRQLDGDRTSRGAQGEISIQSKKRWLLSWNSLKRSLSNSSNLQPSVSMLELILWSRVALNTSLLSRSRWLCLESRLTSMWINTSKPAEQPKPNEMVCSAIMNAL